MSRATERYRQNVARENHDAITTRNENTNALEAFEFEEGLSPEAANTPETNPLSEFEWEEATPPQPEVMTDPVREMLEVSANGYNPRSLLSENTQLSTLPDHHVALATRVEIHAKRRWPFEGKRYAALAAGIAAAVVIGLTIIVLDRPPVEIAVKTTPSEPTAIRETALRANHFPLVPALLAVSPAPPREPSSDSPSFAHSDATEPERATLVSRGDTVVAAKPIPPSAALPQPAVAADAPAAPSTLIAATPVVPSAIAPVPAVRTAPLAPIDNLAETDVIQTVLGRYQGAFGALDSVAASAVWPTVDRKALSRAFERLEEQRIEFDKCQIAVEGRRAVASCDGRSRYVPRVGNKSPRTEARHWRFTLLRLEQEWLIDQVESR